VDIENFARMHPMAYVHVAYSIVWGLHLAFVLWIIVSWRRTNTP
jgi:hypothetical protein